MIQDDCISKYSELEKIRLKNKLKTLLYLRGSFSNKINSKSYQIHLT